MNRLDFNNRIFILDGAMGTMLAPYLKTGQAAESLNLAAPEKVRDVHEKYVRAGADIIYTNTFGANRLKYPDINLLKQVITGGVMLAKCAASGTGTKIALSLGPLGALLEPFGKLTFDEAYGYFYEAAFIGAEAGADLIAIETMTDLLECKAAVIAAKETGLPVFATMSFDGRGMTFTGASAESAAVTLTALGVSAIGLNCSTGPEDMIPAAGKILSNTHLPVIVKANAGLPDMNGVYGMGAKKFAGHYKTLTNMGVSIIGGCCGTTPGYISELSKLRGSFIPRKTEIIPAVSSNSQIVKLDRILIVGERINPTGNKQLKQALIERDYGCILEQAVSQTAAGADILDVNCGAGGINETEVLSEVIMRVQSISDAPLQIDSASADAIEKALKCYRGRPVVNSVNADYKVLNKILPLIKRYGAMVIGLTLDEKGIPDTAGGRTALAARIIECAGEHGVAREDIIIDPLTMTSGAESGKATVQAVETLKAVRELSIQGCKTILGISNVSYGLPERELLNSTFLTAALTSGLALAIINPCSRQTADTVAAYRVLTGEDGGAAQYSSRLQKSCNEPVAADTVERCVISGFKDECVNLIKEKIASRGEPAGIIDELISALDLAGRQYEEGKLYLPNLLMAAEAAKAGFDIIKSEFKQSVQDKGKIILATVRGDIHDIGKNIVKAILSNYGYQIIDLGKNVDSAAIIERAKSENVRLIGLSALMTTTVKNMQDIIKDIKESGHPCKIMAGGAVLTEEYGKRIGADFYAKDANAAVKIAKQVLK